MKRIAIVLTLLIVLLAPSSMALAAPHDRIIRDGDRVTENITVIDDVLIVEEGGVVDGDVTVFDGTVEIAGEVTGDVTVFGGDVIVSGAIDGDLVLFAGNLDLRPGATVGGSCFSFGASVNDESDAVSCPTFGEHFIPGDVLGAIVPPERLTPDRPTPPEPPVAPEVPTPRPPEVRGPSLTARLGYFFLDVGEVVGRSLLLGILALIVATVFPSQLQRVSYAIRRKPAASGAVGILTAIGGPSLIVLLLVVLAITCVGLLLYPAVFLLALAMLGAALFGWVALGDVLGRMLFRSLHGNSQPLAVALGTALLTLVFGGLGLLPFIWGEGLAIGLLVCVGLGAAALTQFGTKPYPPGSPPENSDKVEATLKTMPSE
ncbi:MAG TPA: polymer-forming cytoskeletal protein [Candidatus Sulfomarinibacteraceae bacterium]|nr:polymer-forming cytoskeletal protein [Candidatus Sulfomarinibacteraceae bacterium]